jgi:hypothetical protein
LVVRPADPLAVAVAALDGRGVGGVRAALVTGLEAGCDALQRAFPSTRTTTGWTPSQARDVMLARSGHQAP